PDRKASGCFGLWRSTVTEQYVRHVVPQEHGHHVETRWIELASEAGVVVRIDGARPFGFAASHHRAEDLTAALHASDLVPPAAHVLPPSPAPPPLGAGASERM